MAAALAADDVSLELRDDKACEDVDLVADLTSAREEEAGWEEKKTVGGEEDTSD